ncbi:hypothetical protein GCM10020254_12170 [Streptomyces goshikiensis]
MTTRALAPLDAVTVKVFPDRVKPVTSPAVAAAAGAAVDAAVARGRPVRRRRARPR